MAVWKINEASAHLGKVIEEAYRSGPQTITRNGVAEAVLLSAEDYRNLAALRPDIRSRLPVEPSPTEEETPGN